LISKLAVSVPEVRAVFRDRLNLVATLSQVLCSLSVTNNAKISKVLDVLKFVSLGIEINRLDGTLTNLISKLIG
jgi:hypothetical protein